MAAKRRLNEDDDASNASSSGLKKKITPAGAGMKHTLQKHGKNVEKDVDKLPRLKKPLPRSDTAASSAASNNGTENSDNDSENFDDQPRPSKRRRTEQPRELSDDDDELIELDIPPKPLRADLTPEEDLVNRIASWTSPTYALFKQPSIKYVKQGNKTRIAQAFPCMFCPHVHNRYNDTGDRNSTGSMKKHSVACIGEEAVKSIVAASGSPAEIREKLKGRTRLSIQSKGIRGLFDNQRKAGVATYSTVQHTETQTRAEIVRWVTESLRPFETVADRGLLSLLKTGRPGYWVPHPTTVARDVKRAFAKTRQRIAKILREYPGRINFSTDAWTSPNHHAYIAVTVHLILDAAPESILLDFFELPESHTGNTMAREIHRVFEEFDIVEKVGKMTADNASNNDTLSTSMAQRILHFLGEDDRGRCFNHTLHLVGKAFLWLFDPPKKKKQSADDDINLEDLRTALERIAEGEDVELSEEETETLREALRQMNAELDDVDASENTEKSGPANGEWDSDNDDVEGLVDPRAECTPEEAAALDEEVKHVRRALVRIRTLAYKIVNSTTSLLPAWRAALAEHALPILLIPRDVRTRWNSTFDMLAFVLKYRDIVDSFTADRRNDVRDCELDETDWELLQSIHDVLEVIKQATMFFSNDSALIADVIPAMDKIDDLLTTQLVTVNNADGSERTIHISHRIRTAVLLAKRTLNKYYTLTDYTSMYRICMVLDPRRKLEYFHERDWPNAWINEAKKLTTNVYKSDYQRRTDLLPDEDTSMASKPLAKTQNMFSFTQRKRAPADVDELARYLSTSAELDVADIVDWWLSHSKTYPRLSRMALDYHSIPATSTAVERVFSRARRLISWERNRLSSQSTRATMCTGYWSLKGYVFDDDLAVVTRSGRVRPSRGEEDLVDVDLPAGFDAIVDDD